VKIKYFERVKEEDKYDADVDHRPINHVETIRPEVVHAEPETDREY
jgi:hypothetical protein